MSTLRTHLHRIQCVPVIIVFFWEGFGDVQMVAVEIAGREFVAFRAPIPELV
jgi:hypothetical protein